MANTTAERIPDEMIERARSADLRVLAERYGELRPCSGPKELEGACPKCGGSDRFHVTAEWFFCRQCHPKRGDSIEFLRWLSPGLSFAEAVQHLAGGALPAAATTRRAAAHRAAPAKPQPANWQGDTERLVREAAERLWRPEGEPARAYLERRALEAHIWLAYGLGYVPDAPIPGTRGQQRAAAIVLPWRSASGALPAVRFRFLLPQGEHGEHRLTALYGSQFAGKLFGGCLLPATSFEPLAEGERPGESVRSLLIVEGEINAMSCHQVAGETRLDVLSVGSESADLSPAAVAYAKRYRRVLLWADKAEVAQRLMGALPGSYGVRSPGGQDANDLLRDGLLGGFLATVRADAARDARELEGLLWDLWDASLLLMGVDSSTAAVIGELAKRLGKQARLVEPEPGRWVAAEVYEKWGQPEPAAIDGYGSLSNERW